VTCLTGVRRCLATVVEWLDGYAHHSCTVACMLVAWQPIVGRPVLVAMVTNSSKTSVSIGRARCCKGKAIHNSELVSLWKRKKSVSGIGVS
jgi:hypothetical protein